MIKNHSLRAPGLLLGMAMLPGPLASFCFAQNSKTILLPNVPGSITQTPSNFSSGSLPQDSVPSSPWREDTFSATTTNQAYNTQQYSPATSTVQLGGPQFIQQPLSSLNAASKTNQRFYPDTQYRSVAPQPYAGPDQDNSSSQSIDPERLPDPRPTAPPQQRDPNYRHTPVVEPIEPMIDEAFPFDLNGPISKSNSSGRFQTASASSDYTGEVDFAASARIAAARNQGANYWNSIRNDGVPVPPISPEENKPTQEELDRTQREQTAQQISYRLLAEPERVRAVVPQPIENPQGWSAVADELRNHLDQCDRLLRRGAIQSSRQEAVIGLRTLFRAIDSRSGDWYSEPRFERAMVSFTEERDFHEARPGGSVNVASCSLIAGHQTPALKGADLSSISPTIASQHYRAYARREMVAASQGHPWAADFYYALGKTYDGQADANADSSTLMYREQAICCYQAALDIRNDHADAANQLGFSLLKTDRLEDAQAAIQVAIQTQPTSAAWRNMAEVYRRRSDINRQNYAANQALAIDATDSRLIDGKRMPDVMELTPQQFAAISPNQTQSVQNPGVYVNQAAAGYPVATPMQNAVAPAQYNQTRLAEIPTGEPEKKNLFQKLFK